MGKSDSTTNMLEDITFLTLIGHFMGAECMYITAAVV